MSHNFGVSIPGLHSPLNTPTDHSKRVEQLPVTDVTTTNRNKEEKEKEAKEEKKRRIE